MDKAEVRKTQQVQEELESGKLALALPGVMQEIGKRELALILEEASAEIRRAELALRGL